MTRDELKELASECLAKAFRGEQVQPHIVQAATAVLLAPEPASTASIR